jgi:polyketide synthase PksM
VRQYITDFVAGALRIPAGSIRADRDLRDYGLDSVTGRRLLRGVTERFGVTLSGRELLEHQTIDQLAGVLARREASQGNGAGPCAAGPAPGAADEEQVTSEYLQRFREGLMDLNDVKKMINRGDFL